MLEAIFYVVAFGAALIGLILCPKTEKKINLLAGIMVSYVAILSVGSLGAFLMNIIKIPICLQSMGTLYLLIALVGFCFCIKKKRIQKCRIEKWDLAAIAIGALIVGGISLYIFTPYIYINYANAVDPSRHFEYAMRILRDRSLSGMYFSSLYNGMFIGLFQWIFPLEWSYKAFILADIYHTFVEFLFFYVTIKILLDGNKKKWIPIVISILYWCGYPMFTFVVGGYIYWGMAAMLAAYIMLLLRWYAEKAGGGRMLLGLSLIGCFAVSICYILLAPGMFLTLYGVIAYPKIKEKKWQLDKKSVIMILCGIVAVVICALIGYRLIFVERDMKIFEIFKIGSMETNSLELLVIAPIVAFVLLEIRRRKESWNVFHIGIFVFMSLQLVMTLMAGIGLVSTYYLFKTYNVLWFLVFAVLIEKYRYIGQERKKWLYGYICGVLVILILSYNGEENVAFGIKSSIYIKNIGKLVNEDFSANYMSDKGKIDLFRYAAEELSDETSCVPLVVTNERVGAGSWYCGLYREGCYFVKAEWTPEELEEELEQANVQYFMVFYDDSLYWKYLGDYFETYEKVYSNENGFIARRYPADRNC